MSDESSPGEEPHRTVVSVRYSETDAMGVAHHASYLPWLELGRTGWIRGRGEGRSYRRLEEAGYFLPVVELSCRYHLPARYDDELAVLTTLREASRIRFVFDYRVEHGADGGLLATARTEHAVVDGAGRPRRLPTTVHQWLLGDDAAAPP
ncbi:MAG: thioesterase family protein [Acidobacteriota bacterium]